ncbi:hypothetical protein CCP2SC5_600009 [Azospirillaceae bacterium]
MIVPGVKAGENILSVRRSLNGYNDIALFLVFTTQPTPIRTLDSLNSRKKTIDSRNSNRHSFKP